MSLIVSLNPARLRVDHDSDDADDVTRLKVMIDKGSAVQNCTSRVHALARDFWPRISRSGPHCTASVGSETREIRASPACLPTNRRDLGLVSALVYRELAGARRIRTAAATVAVDGARRVSIFVAARRVDRRRTVCGAIDLIEFSNHFALSNGWRVRKRFGCARSPEPGALRGARARMSLRQPPAGRTRGEPEYVPGH